MNEMNFIRSGGPMNRSTITVLIAVLTGMLALAPLPAYAAVEGSFQRSLKVSGPVDLDISTGSGSITVRPGSSDTVEIRGRIRATDWMGNAEEKVRRLEANPPIQQNGNSIRIGQIEEPELRRNVSISYEVTVPAETELKAHSGSGSQNVDGIRGPVEVNAGSGSIKISNIGGTVRAETGSGSMDIDHVKGNVRAHAGSGSIRATDVAGGFEANTGSGRITLSQTAPGAVRAETGSGGMELRGVHGSLEARAGSGDIHADGDPTGGWIVHTGSGGVHLRLPNDAAFDLNAHTSSGSISLNHPVTVQGTIGRKEVRGKVRGGGVQVEVQTGSGNIEIL
jgi:DUF4097 and DUF4098 domain-containing protein YvlB